jgi:endonuclease I
MKRYIFFILLFSVFIISCDNNTSTTNNAPCTSNPCAESPITHKTVCEPIGDTDFTCICENGYELDVRTNLCIRPEIDPCDPNPCTEENKTKCIAVGVGDSAHPECQCDDGYHLNGENCIETVNPCDPNPCTEENKTKCIIVGVDAPIYPNNDDSAHPECQCNDDYELVDGICKEIPLSDGCFMPRYEIIFQDDLRNLNLINKLHEITSENYVSLGYTSAKNELYNNIDNIDGENQCVYTGNWHDAGSGVNCEHTWPQSQLGNAEPMKSDLHHLFPTESRANSSRGHLRFANIADHLDDYKDYDDYGQCNPDLDDYYCSKRLLNGGDDGIFEPADQHKGNVARAIFYFAIRWGNLSGEINNVVAPFINQDMKMALKKWSKLDVVDDYERLRNDRIEGWLYIDGVREFSRLQGNRNPFIDCPELLDRIDLDNINFPEAYND